MSVAPGAKREELLRKAALHAGGSEAQPASQGAGGDRPSSDRAHGHWHGDNVHGPGGVRNLDHGGGAADRPQAGGGGGGGTGGLCVSGRPLLHQAGDARDPTSFFDGRNSFSNPAIKRTLVQPLDGRPNGSGSAAAGPPARASHGFGARPHAAGGARASAPLLMSGIGSGPGPGPFTDASGGLGGRQGVGHRPGSAAQGLAGRRASGEGTSGKKTAAAASSPLDSESAQAGGGGASVDSARGENEKNSNYVEGGQQHRNTAGNNGSDVNHNMFYNGDAARENGNYGQHFHFVDASAENGATAPLARTSTNDYSNSGLRRKSGGRVSGGGPTGGRSSASNFAASGALTASETLRTSQHRLAKGPTVGREAEAKRLQEEGTKDSSIGNAIRKSVSGGASPTNHASTGVRGNDSTKNGTRNSNAGENPDNNDIVNQPESGDFVVAGSPLRAAGEGGDVEKKNENRNEPRIVRQNEKRKIKSRAWVPGPRGPSLRRWDGQ
eukprot:gene329-263_t